MAAAKRAAIYLLVSTDRQSTESQRLALTVKAGRAAGKSWRNTRMRVSAAPRGGTTAPVWTSF